MTRASFYQTLTEHGAALHPAHKVRPDGTCSCARDDCRAPGKHPVPLDWQNADSRSLKVVDKWLDSGLRNVSVALHGRLFVVDVDLPSLDGLDLPETLTVATPRGGRHLYYTAPGEPPPNAAGTTGLGPGVDIRAEGGQVIGPGSVGVQGPYVIVDDRPIAEAPPELVARCHPTTTPASRNGHTPDTTSMAEDELLAPVAEGQRNTTLTSRVGKLVAQGLTKEQVLAQARFINEAALQPPLPDAEVSSVVDSITKREESALRHLPCNVVKQHQYGTENPRYEWELADGTRIDMGSSPTHVGASAAHRALVPHGFVMSPTARKKEWTQIVKALLAITEVHETATEAETTVELVEAYLWNRYIARPGDDFRAWFRGTDEMSAAIDSHGTLWLNLPALTRWSADMPQARPYNLTNETWAKRLSRIGFRNAGRFRSGSGRQVRVWQSPPGFGAAHDPDPNTGPAEPELTPDERKVRDGKEMTARLEREDRAYEARQKQKGES